MYSQRCGETTEEQKTKTDSTATAESAEETSTEKTLNEIIDSYSD